jgi:hypothetical protein
MRDCTPRSPFDYESAPGWDWSASASIASLRLNGAFSNRTLAALSQGSLAPQLEPDHEIRNPRQSRTSVHANLRWFRQVRRLTSVATPPRIVESLPLLARTARCRPHTPQRHSECGSLPPLVQFILMPIYESAWPRCLLSEIHSTSLAASAHDGSRDVLIQL